MVAPKEINTKILSIKKTQKITRAMQMVAASKMRKAEARMATSAPYAEKIRAVMQHIASSHSEYKHRHLRHRETVNNVGYIVVATDRGLCGGLNINLFRFLLQHIQEWHNKEVGVSLCLFGGKAVSFFKYIDINILAKAQGFGDMPKVSNLIGGVKVMLDDYDAGKLDRLFIVHNEFVNKMVQRPCLQQLLPVLLDDAGEAKRRYWDYIYEPDPRKLLDAVVSRYIETQVYQAVVDNLACEQAARMVAMKSATDNAEKLVERLRLVYNKLRQASITQEIAEIINGAESIV